MAQTSRQSNRALFLPYVLPYAIYTLLASLPEGWLSPEQSYLARLLGAGAAVVWAWSRYPALRGPRSLGGSAAVGVIAGLLGTVLWVALVAPFAPEGEAEPVGTLVIGLRLVAATLLVPVFEEILMRGYFLRVALQWEEARNEGAPDPLGVAFNERSIHNVGPGSWTPVAVGISTALFMLGHGFPEWPAAAAYGLLMAGLWIWRQDLWSCIVAHGVTNLTLGAYVVATGSWAIW
jgi:membrane protease YdiL (CAAX protease family)